MNLNEVGGGQRGAWSVSPGPTFFSAGRTCQHSVSQSQGRSLPSKRYSIHSSIHPFSSVTTGSYTRVDPGPSSENEGIQGRYPHRIDDRGSRIDSTTTSTSTSTSTSTQDVQDHHPPHLVALAVGRFRPRSSYRTPFATLVARPDSHAHAHAHARFLRSVRSPTRTCLRRTRIGSSTSSCTPCTAIGMSS
jgi:hypothetical protein